MLFVFSVPPREVNIMDESGQRIEETIGPVDEGSNVTLICEAEGGMQNIFELFEQGLPLGALRLASEGKQIITHENQG